MAARLGLCIQVGLLAATVTVLVLFRDRLPDFGAMWDAAWGADPLWVPVVVVSSAMSLGAFARIHRRLLRVGGVDMTRRRAFAVTLAGNAMSATLPAGAAVSVIYMFRQFRLGGATAQLATAVLLVGGVITTTAYTLVGALTLLASPSSRDLTLVALLAPALALALALWPRRSRALLVSSYRRLLAWQRVAPHLERLRQGRDALRFDRRDWGALVVLSLANWVFDILALFAAAKAVGVDIAPHVAALAYFAAQAAGTVLPLLPGGLGAIEASMAASLVALGATLAPAGAAVGLYRLVSFAGMVAAGWLAWIALHERPRTLAARWLPAPGAWPFGDLLRWSAAANLPSERLVTDSGTTGGSIDVPTGQPRLRT